jgi:hypothetical protein
MLEARFLPAVPRQLFKYARLLLASKHNLIALRQCCDCDVHILTAELVSRNDIIKASSLNASGLYLML